MKKEIAQKSVIEQIAEAMNPEVGVPTLKAIAAAMDVPYARIRSVAKQPEEGMVYDAKAFNYHAISRFIERRLTPDNPDSGFATMENVIARAMEFDKAYKEADGRRAPTVGNNIITLRDGTQIPARRHTCEIGMKTYIKKDPKKKVYEIVYTTISHIILREIDGEELVCMSNNTINYKIAKPTFEQLSFPIEEATSESNPEEATASEG